MEDFFVLFGSYLSYVTFEKNWHKCDKIKLKQIDKNQLITENDVVYQEYYEEGEFVYTVDYYNHIMILPNVKNLEEAEILRQKYNEKEHYCKSKRHPDEEIC